jgi:hypothetical protein
MNSLWVSVNGEGVTSVCCDKRAVARSRLGTRRTPVLGIFTDHPANIVRRLPRPLTPFVPAPESVLPQKQSYWDKDAADQTMAGSPPVNNAFGFGEQTSEQPRVALGFF